MVSRDGLQRCTASAHPPIESFDKNYVLADGHKTLRMAKSYFRTHFNITVVFRSDRWRPTDVGKGRIHYILLYYLLSTAAENL